MALLHESVDFKKLDVRLIERNIARGVLNPEELEQALKKLPDDSENAQWISLESLEEEIDESELNGRGSYSHQH